MKDIIAKLTAIAADADSAPPKKSLTESSFTRGSDNDEQWAQQQGAKNTGARTSQERGYTRTSQERGTDNDEKWALAQGKKVKESEDDSPRLAFGKRDWDAEAEDKPHDKFLAYKAKGGKLSRRQWEEDRDNGLDESFDDSIYPKRSEHDKEESNRTAAAVEKYKNKGHDDQFAYHKKLKNKDAPAEKVDEVSAAAMGRHADNEFAGGLNRQPIAAPSPRPAAPVARKYLVKDPSGKVVGTYANAPEAVAARKKMRNPDSYSIVKEGVKRPRKHTVVTESVKFKVGDSALAKVLRRFPKEMADFKSGADLSDDLYDAVFDHYCNNGEMPYGTMKARDGDPYEWVTNRLDMELKHEGVGLDEGAVHEDPAVRAILDKYPHEAKQFETFGELDDGPLYHELFDHYLDSGEMPYGIAKARTGDPVQWVAEQAERDLGIDAPPTGDDMRPEYDSAEELSSHEDYEPPMEGMGGDIMPMEDLGDDVETPPATPVVPQRDMQLPQSDYQAHRDESMMRRNDGPGLGEDSVDPTLDAGHVLVEDDEAEITSTLSEVGLDEGLDFFFENGELVVIGRSTATVAINALKGKFQASVGQVDGEEVRMQVGPIGSPSPSPVSMPPMESAVHVDEAVTENVNLNITADGEDDVLAIIRKLSGLSSEIVDTDSEIEVHPQISTMGDMAGLTSAMDSISADHADAMDYENEISAIVSGEDHDDDMDEAEYANSPEPEVHTSTTQMINQGNDLNRPKQMYARAQPGDNPMAVRPMDEARRLMKQYEAMKRDVSSK